MTDNVDTSAEAVGHDAWECEQIMCRPEMARRIRALLRQRDEARAALNAAAGYLARNVVVPGGAEPLPDLLGLCTQVDNLASVRLRPDIAAILRGLAVAVPREPTSDMVQAAWVAGDAAKYHEIYCTMIAASPYAPKESVDE